MKCSKIVALCVHIYRVIVVLEEIREPREKWLSKCEIWPTLVIYCLQGDQGPVGPEGRKVEDYHISESLTSLKFGKF